MMHIIEISENKMEHLGENVEKALKYMGKVMQCVEEMKEHSRMGERYDEDDEYDGRMNERYGNRGNSSEEGQFGMRGSRGGGRYGRY